MADSFLLSQPFVQKIRSTIERVDGTPLPGAGGVKRGPLLEDPGVQSSASKFRIATFDGAWAKGSTKTVTLHTDTANGSVTPSNTTVTATNLFMDLGNQNATDSKCAIAKVGASWFLVEAELECKEVVTKVEPAGSLTLVSSVSVEGSKVLTGLMGSVVTDVKCVDGQLLVTTDTLANLAIESDVSDLIQSNNITVTLGSIASVTSENLSLPPQGGCDASG